MACPFSSLQTVRNKKAKACVSQEFVKSVLAKLVKEVQHKVLPRLHEMFPKLKRAPGGGVLYQWDNASIHTRASPQELGKLGITHEMVLEHPENSPEFNKVVEHTHANLAKAFEQALAETALGKDVEGYKRLFQRTAMPFHHVPAYATALTAGAIARDFESLPDTWNAVVAANGNGIPRSLK